MAIDLLNLEPQQISRSLSGKFILCYGAPKVGKTTLASELDKVLIAGFEQGTNALHNVLVQPILKWQDWKAVVKQLIKDKDKLADKIHTVAIDTVDEAYKLCEKYMCNQASVETVKDIAAYGGGYKMVDDEFSSTLRELSFAGYGLFFISHEKTKALKDDKGNDYEKAVPALADRPYNIVNKMVDMIAYLRQVEVQEGEDVVQKRYLFFRGDNRYHAGSRFKYIVPYVELSYKNLVNAIYDAIDKEIAEKGGQATEKGNPYLERGFDDLMEEAKSVWAKATANDKVKEVSSILEEEFGKPTKFSEITPDQIEKLTNVLFKVKDII